jgi:hypothetical protein
MVIDIVTLFDEQLNLMSDISSKNSIKIWTVAGSRHIRA